MTSSFSGFLIALEDLAAGRRVGLRAAGFDAVMRPSYTGLQRTSVRREEGFKKKQRHACGEIVPAI